MKTISEHEGLFWVADASGQRLITHRKALGLLYSAEVAGQREKRADW